MRGLNSENKQSEKAIVGSAYNPTIVSSKSRFVSCRPTSQCHSVAGTHFEPSISMRLRSLMLLVLLVPLSGCIVTYRDFPNATLESLLKDRESKPLYYHVEPIIAADSPEHQEKAKEAGTTLARFGSIMSMTLLLGWYGILPQMDPIGQPGYDEVARTLTASGVFSDLREAPAAPDTGVYCHIDFDVRERSPWLTFYEGINFVATIGSLGAFAPAVMVNALPYYAGEGGTTVVYTLYRDGRLKQIYRYPITKQGAGWIVLLPFAWLNFFTNDLKDAVHGTTLQFLIDAQRDDNI